MQINDRILQGEDTPDRNLACLKGFWDAEVSGVDKNSGEVSRENSKMTVGTGGGGGGQMA